MYYKAKLRSKSATQILHKASEASNSIEIPGQLFSPLNPTRSTFSFPGNEMIMSNLGVDQSF